MALVRVTPIKDFRATALSTTDNSTGYLLGALTTGQKLYGGLHLTQPASTDRPLVFTVQGATSSAFGALTTALAFTQSSARGAQLLSVGALSTELKWWRTKWLLATTASTAGSVKGLGYLGIR